MKKYSLPILRSLIFGIYLLAWSFTCNSVSVNTIKYAPDRYSRFLNFTTKEGLSSNIVLDILQDRFGIMWFATLDGLTRFDGNFYTVYRNDADNANSLSCNQVLSLAEDYLGNLWVGTKNGLNYYDRKTNSFKRYYAKSKDINTIPNNYIKALYTDSIKNLWVETKGAYLCKYNQTNKKWTYISHQGVDFEGEYYYHHIFEDSKNNLWIGGRETGIHKVSHKDISSIGRSIGNKSGKGNEGSCYAETKDENLISCDYAGFLSRYDYKENLFETIAHIPISATSAVCDDKNRIWIGGESGIVTIDLSTNEAKILRNNLSNPFSLISNQVFCLYKDRNNNIWIGTDKGVCLYSERLNLFQHYRYFQNTENGLSSNNITALMQDRDDLIWVGTEENGVDTFSIKHEKFGNLSYNLLRHDLDKKTFEREKQVLRQYYIHSFITSKSRRGQQAFNNYDCFKQTLLNFRGTNENKVSTLYEDMAGNIYIGLWSHVGFNIYNKKNGNFKRHALWSRKADDYFPILFEGNLFGANWYAGFLEDRESRFWCATWEGVGLNLFDREKGEFTGKHYIPGSYPRYPKSLIHSFAFDPKRNQLFMGGALYYGYYNFNKKKFNRYGQLLPNGYPNKELINRYYKNCKSVIFATLPYDFRCYRIVFDGSDVAWLSTQNSILKHTISLNRFEPVMYEAPETYCSFITALSSDKKYLWICKNNKQLFRLSVKDNAIIPFKDINKEYAKLLQNETINVLYEGGSLNLWIGTDSGIFKYDRRKNYLCQFIPKISGNELTAFRITAITGNNEKQLFIGGSIGILVLTNEKSTAFYPCGSLEQDALPGALINQIYPYRINEIWVCTDNGLACIHEKTKKITVYQHDEMQPYCITGNNVLAIAKGENDDLWVSTTKGLCLLNRKTGMFTDLSAPDENTLSSRLASCIAQDGLGNIWLGTTEKGINVLVSKTDKIRHYCHHAWDTASLSDNYVNCIFEDSKRNIWVGTSKGLDKYIPEDDNFKHINELKTREVRSVQEDKRGYLWVATDKGLYCLSPLGRIENCFYDYHGLPDNEFTKASCRLEDGKLAFGGNNGFIIFSPDLIRAHKKPAEIVFSRFQVRDSVFYFDLSNEREIFIRYKENSFSVNFSATDYTFGKYLNYRYKLTGFDNVWNYTDSQHLGAKYTNIPPGDYVLEVEVSNEFGEWNGAIKKLAIHISTPWFLQWWFFTLVIVCLICILIVIVRLRERNMKQRSLLLENTVAERTLELTESNKKLNESQDELKKMIDTKNKFFSIISHDLKNPIQDIGFTSKIFFDRYNSLDENEKYHLLRLINDTIQHTGTLLDNLLMWSLSQQDIMAPNIQIIKLSDHVNSTVNILEHMADKKKIKIINQVNDGIFIYADDNMLSTILRNLVSNAIKFSHPGGEVVIMANSSRAKVDISVKDNGVGIDEKNIGNLFRIDSKLCTRGTKKEQGTGLGLIITNEFVEKLGGKIYVESTINKGSIFTFTLERSIQ